MLNYILSVSADTAFYEKWADILQNKGLFNDGVRVLLWGLTKVLVWICDACEKLLVMANKAIGFIYSDKVVEFISQWRFIIIGVLILAVLLFGITMIANKKQDRSKLVQNFAIAACVLIGLSTFIPTLSKNTASWSASLLSSDYSSSAQILKGSVTDLYYLDSQNFSNAAAERKNNFSAERIKNIDPTEEITSSDNVLNPKIFSYRLSYDEKGYPVLEDIDDSGFSWNNDPYYRYDIDFTTISITLFATAIVMIFTAFKVVKIVFDIIVHQILAVVLAAGDWASGQKLKEVIKSLFALFFSVFMCSVMMKLYFLFSAWASSNIESGIARALLLLFAAFAVIDGPNIVEKIFGIDAGLASTFRSVSTLFFAASGASRVAKGAGHGISSLIRGAAHGAGGTGGFFKGLSNSIKNTESNHAGKKQNIADSAANKNNPVKSSDNSAKNKNASNSENQKNTAASQNANKEDNLNLNGSNNASDQNNLSAENKETSKSIANAAADTASVSGNSVISDSASKNAASENHAGLSDKTQKENHQPHSDISGNHKNTNLSDDLKPNPASNSSAKPDDSRNTGDSLKNSVNNGSDSDSEKPSLANASAEKSSRHDQPEISEKEDLKNKSISNTAASKNISSANSDFINNKARNHRSVIGAGARGYQNGQLIGEKVGNTAAKLAKKKHLEGDEK